MSIWSETAGLSVRGCLLAVLRGTQTWGRVTSLDPGHLRAATDMPDGPRSDPEWAVTGPKARTSDGQAAQPRQFSL
ncbi:hypothetical protein [Methylobacterium sp. NEAU K]|uniref:hypothetical protein n=1 Tax=Methylobacterium sp. NEAU K TaxID=3064946 RepID=UPI00351DC1D7